MKNLFLTILLVSSFSVFGQIGEPDANFGVNGIAFVNLGDQDYLYDLKILPDGKIICLSKSFLASANGYFPAICRLNPDASIDGSFGVNGSTFLEDEVFLLDSYFGLAIDAQGRAVVAATVSNEIIVYRLTASGSLDTDFSFDGKVTVDFDAGVEKIGGLAIQSDGKIVLGCTTNNDFGIVRLNTDGTFDSSFGTSGKQSHSIYAIDVATDIAIQSDGKILICGSADDGFGDWAVVVRLNSNGSLDTTFDGDGKAERIINSSDVAYAIAIQSDGKILIAGKTAISTLNQSGFVACFNSDGSDNTSFNSNGLLEVNFSGAADLISSMTLQPDGKILTGGTYDLNGNEPALWTTRINPDGNFDADFAINGSSVYTISSTSFSTYAMDLTPSGDLILGSQATYITEDLVLLKLKTGLNIGINELESRTVVAYPNPTSDFLNLNLREFSQSKRSVQIFNSEGKLVINDQTTSNTLEIDVRSLANGAYSCVVTSETEKATFQFTKN